MWRHFRSKIWPWLWFNLEIRTHNCCVNTYIFFADDLQMVYIRPLQKQPCRGVLSKKTRACPNTCSATLLKSNFDMGVLLQIGCIFSEHLFPGTPLGGCFCPFLTTEILFIIKKVIHPSIKELNLWNTM